MGKQVRAKRNPLLRSIVWLLWLAIFGFIGYRAVRSAPSDRGKLYFVHTKFNGYQEQILQPKQYYISWQNWLPANVDFVAIPNEVQELHFSQHYRLPSAENYQILLPRLSNESLVDRSEEINPFVFHLELTLRYRYRAEELLAHVSNPANDFTSAAPNQSASTLLSELVGGVDEGLRDLAQRLRTKLQERLDLELQNMFADSSTAKQGAGTDIQTVENYLAHELGQGFPQLDVLSVDVRRYQQPDLWLYSEVKQAYHELLQQLSSESLAQLLQQQNSRIAQELYLQNIERLGEILTQHPILIQYFAVTQGDALSANLRSQILQSRLSSGITPSADAENTPGVLREQP